MLKNMMQIGKKASFMNKFRFNSFKSFSNKLNNDSFITGTSGIYIEKMHEQWKKDPKSVHLSWDVYFSNIDSGMDYLNAFQSPPTIDKGKKSFLFKCKFLNYNFPFHIFHILKLLSKLNKAININKYK
jgi:2-oxoglutarate dehydrogenase complex dehydrogenase (E1) component-like enzyme